MPADKSQGILGPDLARDLLIRAVLFVRSKSAPPSGEEVTEG